MSAYIPARGETVIVRNAHGVEREAVVTAFNYFFERIDGVYVDYRDVPAYMPGAVDQLAWLHQLQPAG